MPVINDRMAEVLEGAILRLESGRDPFEPRPGDPDHLRSRSQSPDERSDLAALLAVGTKLLVYAAEGVQAGHSSVRNPAIAGLRDIGVAVAVEDGGVELVPRATQAA